MNYQIVAFYTFEYLFSSYYTAIASLLQAHVTRSLLSVLFVVCRKN